MKAFELDSWALRILDRVEKNMPKEDSLVELKKDWPDPKDIRIIRQLAGQANAARGDNILWLIGAQETPGLVCGAKFEELANWLPQMQSNFDGQMPAAQPLNVTYKGVTVAALCFDTSRFPYVVRNPSHGKTKGEFELEVPWRDGTKTRSARHDDLVLMLAPLVKTPKIEILECQIVLNDDDSTAEFQLEAFVVPRSSGVCFPAHKLKASVSSENHIIADSFGFIPETPVAKARRIEFTSPLQSYKPLPGEYVPHNLRYQEVENEGGTIEATKDHITARGAGKFCLNGVSRKKGKVVKFGGELLLRLALFEVNAELPMELDAKCVWQAHSTRWTLAK